MYSGRGWAYEGAGKAEGAVGKAGEAECRAAWAVVRASTEIRCEAEVATLKAAVRREPAGQVGRVAGWGWCVSRWGPWVEVDVQGGIVEEICLR